MLHDRDQARTLLYRLLIAELIARPGQGPLARRPLSAVRSARRPELEPARAPPEREEPPR